MGVLVGVLVLVGELMGAVGFGAAPHARGRMEGGGVWVRGAHVRAGATAHVAPALGRAGARAKERLHAISFTGLVPGRATAAGVASVSVPAASRICAQRHAGAGQ